MRFMLVEKGDFIIRRIIKNSGIVFSGNIAASGLNIISFAIVANQLGPEALAFLVLAQTYSGILNDIFNVQTWESMVLFGSKTLRDGNFSRVVKSNLLIDIVSALIAFLVAISLVEWSVGILGWDEAIVGVITLYCVSILTNLTSFTIGIPRLFDKFARISIFRVGVAVFKLLAVVGAMLKDQELITYVYIYLLAEIAFNVLLIVFSLHVLRTEHDRDWWKEKFSFDREQLIFIWWTNIRNIARIPVRYFDMIVISSIISMEMVGVYKVYKEIARVVKLVQDPINQTIFPEFTKLLAAENKIETSRVARKTMLLLGAGSIVFIGTIILLASTIVELVFGTQYLVEIRALHALLFVYVLSFIMVPINSLFIAAGFVKSSFYILVFTNSIYLAAAYFFGALFGIYGIVIAYATQLICNKGLKVYLLVKHPDWGSTTCR